MVHLVLDVVDWLDVLTVELLGRQWADAVEVLLLIPEFPTDGVRRAAQANTDYAEHLSAQV